jgi:hypothetical protein
MLCWGLFGLVVYLYVREKKQRLGSECLASQEVHATAKEKLANFIKKKEKEASKALVQRGMLATRIMASRRNRVKNMVIVDPRNGTVQI